VGEKMSYELSKRYDTLFDLMNASINDLMLIDDIGQVVAQSIYNYLHDEKNLAIINGLINAGVKINYTKKEIEPSIFTGKTVVITGTFEDYSRSGLTNLLQKMGAKVSSSVSKNTDYVIVGENAGSKYDKAVELEVTIITAEDLNNLLKIWNLSWKKTFFTLYYIMIY